MNDTGGTSEFLAKITKVQVTLSRLREETSVTGHEASNRHRRKEGETVDNKEASESYEKKEEEEKRKRRKKCDECQVHMN